MYKVYANDTLIYSPDLVSDEMVIFSPKLSKEVNKSGNFSFYIYSNNPYYKNIKALKTPIVVKDNDYELWRGRVLTIEKDFDNRKKVECEGVLAFFNDSVVRPFTHTKTMADQFRYIIEKHNEEVEEYKQFVIGTIDVDDPYGSKEWKEEGYTKTKQLIDNLMDDYGGYFVVGWNGTKNTLNYVKDPGNRTSNQTINFGENLLDLKVSINPNNVFTVLIPIAYDANQNKITIESVNQGKDYLESTAGVAEYGKIFYEHTFEEDIATPAALKTKGEEFLEKNIKASNTIEIKAIDLHQIDPSINRIDVYDIIKVESEPHGLNEYEMCSKVSINLDFPDNNEYVIGTIPEGITGLINGGIKTSVKATSSLPNGDNVQY